MSGTQLLQAVVDGILTGGVYALMAAGLSLIFGVMDIINIAQGVMVILGGYLSYVLSVHLGIGLLPGLLITVPAMFPPAPKAALMFVVVAPVVTTTAAAAPRVACPL